MRFLIVSLALIASGCAQRHLAVTPISPINPNASLIGNDGGSLLGKPGSKPASSSVISNDGAAVISNDGAAVISNDGGSLAGGSGISAQSTLSKGRLRAPRAAVGLDASETVITLGSGLGAPSMDMTELPVAGASVYVHEVRKLKALESLGISKTDTRGTFSLPKWPKGANLLFEAIGTTSDGKTLRLLGLKGQFEGHTVNMASTLAAVRALRPGSTPATIRASVDLSKLEASITSALDAHPKEALRAAKLLASDQAGSLSIGMLEDLEDALVQLGNVDPPLQAALESVDAALMSAPDSTQQAAAAASDQFTATHP